MAHARLSPSSFFRAELCPGSVREEAKFPDTDNEHSLRGTAAHYVGENCLTDDENPAVYEGQNIMVTLADGVSTQLIKMEREDIEAVAAYVDYVNLRGQQLEGAERSLEVKVNPGGWLGRDDLWGTADCILESDRVIEVIDYKHGYNEVNPEQNSQLLLYAIGACMGRDWTGSDQTETIKMTIVQPRSPNIRGPVRSWEIPAYELFGMLERLRLAAEATDDPAAPLVPGEKQCKYCRAKATCPALMEQATAVFAPQGTLAGVNTQDLQAPGVLQPVQEGWEQNLLRPIDVLDLDTLVKALDQEALVTGWFKSIREHLTELAKQGTNIPNYKLVHAQTRRKWGVDDEELVKKLTGLRDISDKENPRKIKKAEVTETKPLSIAQCEKRIRPLVSERQWKGIEKLITRPEGAPVLAPLTDPREPIKRPEDVFEPQQQEQAPAAPGW